MTAYIVAYLSSVRVGKEIAEYLQRVDATLAAHDGRFLVQGQPDFVLEGPAEGQAVVVEFPSLATALRWYESAEYQAIVGLRVNNATGAMILTRRCPDGHRASDLLPGSRQEPQAAGD